MIDKNLKYTVVGLGATGISVLEFLLKKHCSVLAVDTRLTLPNLTELQNRFPNLPIILGFSALPLDTNVVVISPGVSLQHPAIVAARARGIPIIGDIEIFAQEVEVPVIAITGSNGKSTVVTMIQKMLAACGIKVGLGGNIGVPALSLLEKDYNFFVLELSSFQLDTTYSLKPRVASILNVTADHLDRHGDFVAYHAAKLRIYNNAAQIIVNREDPYTYPINNTESTSSFGFDVPKIGQYGIVTDNDGVLYLAKGQKRLLSVTELKLIGKQNIVNALTALAVADAINLPLANCIAALKSFIGLPHRCELIGKFDNVLWINDSKGTNVGATVAAIEGVAKQISGKLVIILGGISKGADLTPLLEPVLKYCKATIVIGEAKELFKELFAGKIPCYEANSMQQCVAIAECQVVANDSVLLSPACSSLDMFTNFEARGLAFKQAVYAMKGCQ